MATLTVRLLGGLRLERDGVVLHLTSARAKAIVVYLVLHRDQAHERAQLAHLLWPESDERQARTNLRQTLHQLRRSQPVVEHFLALDGQQLQWCSDASLELDVARFDAAVAAARQAQDASDPALERECLEEALRLYRGDLLPEMYDAWLDGARERLREHCGSVLERLMTITEAQRDYRAAVRYAQRSIQHDPLVEAPYQRLMRLHALCGERAKGLHVYHSCASLLQRELSVEPSRETQLAYDEVLRLGSDPAPPAVAPADRAPNAVVPTVAPLVGRRQDMAQLHVAWQQAQAGRASLVLVSGDSGIGKSRLVEEFVRGLPRREATVVAARCYATEGALALAPVTAILRSAALAAALADLDPVWRRELSRLLPELSEPGAALAGPLTESWQRKRLFEAMARVVLAGQPVLLVIDDLQWCDQDTLEWLRFVLRFDADARLLVVATARSHEMSANTELVGLVTALWGEELIRECELGPLTAAETTSLARSLWRGEPTPAALERLVEEAEGIPLFVVEMLRGGWISRVDARPPTVEPQPVPLPPKLRAVIAERLQQLSPTGFELMSMAAVIGREFGFDLLVAVSRQSEDEVMRGLDELWRQRIVREVGAGEYDFTHAKLREVAYAAASLTRRRLLHRYAAEALEDLVEGDGASGQIAYHYDLAAFPERAIPHYRRAAEAARALYAHEEAVNAYERALTLAASLPDSAAFARWRDDVAARLLEGLGDVRQLQGKHEVARERFAEALERLPPADPIGRGRLRRKVGLTMVAQYRYDEALAAFVAAEEALGPQKAGAGVAWWQEWISIGLARSDGLYWQHAWDENARVLGRMEAAVKRHGTALERSQFLARLGFAVFGRGGFIHSDEAVAHLRAALAEAEEADVMSANITVRFLLGFALLWQDDRGEAQAQLEAALAASELVGDAVMRVNSLSYLGFAHRLEGNLAATRDYALRALEAATALAMPEYAGAAHGHLAWLAWRRGDLAAVEAEGEAALVCWQAGRAYPLQWSARLPLMAAQTRRERFEAAQACVAPLLEADRQRLPESLREALLRVARAEPGRERRQAALVRAIAVAEEVGRL